MILAFLASYLVMLIAISIDGGAKVGIALSLAIITTVAVLLSVLGCALDERKKTLCRRKA